MSMWYIVVTSQWRRVVQQKSWADISKWLLQVRSLEQVSTVNKSSIFCSLQKEVTSSGRGSSEARQPVYGAKKIRVPYVDHLKWMREELKWENGIIY